MELQPVTVPVVGHDRAARLRTWIAIVLPIAVLGAVIGGGVLGGLDAEQAHPSEREAVREVPPPTRSSPPAPTPAPTDPPGVPLPTSILGLDVQDVGDARAGPRLERPERLVAIGGWLTVTAADPHCATRWYLACPQVGTISASRAGGTSLRIETQPGAPLIGLQRQDPRAGTSSVPSRAIVVGRFTRPLYRECGLQIPECEPVFTVERLAWIRQTERERPRAFGPGATRATWSPELAESAGLAALSDPGARPVDETLVLGQFDRATLALIDPLAAAATTRGDPADPVWYVRAIVWRDTPRGSEPGVGWAVLDDRTREVLGSSDLRDDPRRQA